MRHPGEEMRTLLVPSSTGYLWPAAAASAAVPILGEVDCLYWGEVDGEGLGRVLDHPDADRLGDLDVEFPRQHRPGGGEQRLSEGLIFHRAFQQLLLNS